MAELTNNDQTLSLHKGFNWTYMNITDYQFMQFLNVTRLTSEQLKWLEDKLPNYTTVNYDFQEDMYNRLMKIFLNPCLLGS